MICLAFEFTSDRRSVAVADGETVLAEVAHSLERRTPVFALIDRALTEAGAAREAVRRLAVSIGPGSYTGVRIAISAAQGWHLATGAEVVPVDTFEVLRVSSKEGSIPLPTTFAVDAQRNEFAVRTCSDSGWDGPMKLETLPQILERLAGGQNVVGPDLGRTIRASAKAVPSVADRAGSTGLFPNASVVARMACRLQPVSPETLAPVYLREAAFVKAPPARVIAGITD